MIIPSCRKVPGRIREKSIGENVLCVVALGFGYINPKSCHCRIQR